MRKIAGKPVMFARYGGLSSVKQRGYGADTFHAPPAKRGIYAFVWPYIETFLLGGGYGTPKMLPGIDDEHVRLVRQRKFEHTGELWCHLSTVQEWQIVDRHGSWVKVAFEDYCDALEEELHALQRGIVKMHHDPHIAYPMPTNNPGYGWGLDHLEVFIEKV